MRTLGAVLAGGLSSRFGSDKAEALYLGVPLIAHAVTALGVYCDTIVIVGREAVPHVPDWPRSGLGPLGGVAGAMLYARDHGFDRVLTTAVDCVALPADLLEALEPGPAYLSQLPVVGLWPKSLFDALVAELAGEGRHSVRDFAARIGARAVTGLKEVSNINTQDDLARLAARAAAPIHERSQ